MKNVIQDYAWGSIHAIPRLLGYGNDENRPQAELWMGSHRRGTSLLLLRGHDDVLLSEFIRANPESVLGAETALLYKDLPFLFKVLAAGSPLSIQVHPNKVQAEEGFENENKRGVPLDAFNRNYKDDNHKPEIMCAMTDFWAMRGFRTFDSIILNFKKADIHSFDEEIQSFSRSRTSEGLKDFFSRIMSLDGEKKKLFIDELVSRARKSNNDSMFEWVLKLYSKYPDDAAIAAPLYLNLVKLKPGQALYLAAGELHAYLDGLGMELMASSDNVLRGGLTPKFIDREELKRIVNFSGADLQVLEPESIGSGVSVYSTPSDEFELARVDLKESDLFEIKQNNNVQILFVSEGQVSVRSEKGDILEVEKGESLFVPSDSGSWILEGEAILFRASIPGDTKK